MKEFFRQHGLRILAAAAAVAVLLSVLTYFSSTSSVLENIAGVLTSPFRAAATAVSDWAADKRQYYEDVTALKEENAALKKEIAELRAQQRDAQAANEHYAQYEGKVQDAATKVNDAYLKAFSEETGVQSYGEVADLLIAWYQQKAPRT